MDIKQEQKGKILIVDDVETHRTILNEILRDAYELEQAADGQEAIQTLLQAERQPDLVLLDVMMPRMDGITVFETMKHNPRTEHTPAIFITGSDIGDHERMALQMGATGYITKPFAREAVRLRVDDCIELSRHRSTLEQELERKVRALSQGKKRMIEGLADAIGYQDFDSGRYVRRTSRLVRTLVEELQKTEDFSGELHNMDISTLTTAALMHDIGKAAVPDSILFKPGRLSDEEYDLVKCHTVIGGEIIDRMMSNVPDSRYQNCKDICLYHHERWDGAGYPYGLKGEEIPLSARIMSVVDVYDALVNRRPYQEPRKHADAMNTILNGAGTQFDPRIAELVVRVWEEEKEQVYVS